MSPLARWLPPRTGEDYQWANAVMAAINAHPQEIRLGAWGEHDRDAILRALVQQRRNPSRHFELIVDDGRANWRLKTAREGNGVRLADYRMSRIGEPEDPAVTAVNEALRRLA